MDSRKRCGACVGSGASVLSVCLIDSWVASQPDCSRHKACFGYCIQSPPSAQATVPEPMKSRVWRAEKDKLNVTTGRIWRNHEWGKRGRHMREYVLNEFWQIFVDDRPVRREAIQHTHTHECTIENSVLLRYEVLDKLDECEEEEKWVGSRFKACTWIYTVAVLCDGQETTQEYSKRREPKFWWHGIMKLMCLAWSSEDCCGSRQKSRSTTML